MNAQRKFKIGEQVETKLRSWTAGKSKNKGTPYVRLTFENYIDWTGWLTPKTMERTMGVLEMLGFKGANLGELANDDALDKTKYVLAVIGESREYNGKTYYSADWINDPDKSFGGFDDNVSKDLMDELKGMDTRAYIDGATSAQQGQSAMDQEYNIDTDASFTANDIPF